MAANLVGHLQQKRGDCIGCRGELGAQLRSLRRDSDRTRVEVARAHHQAPLGDQQRRPERHLVRSEQRCHDDVASRLQAAVGA
jgi:hypothetical protein